MDYKKILIQLILVIFLITPVNIFAADATLSATLNPTPIPSPVIPIAQISPMPTITPTPTPSPDLTVSIKQDTDLTDNKTIQIYTNGLATAEASITQNVNQNTVGNDLTDNVVNTVAPNDKPIDLSQPVNPCLSTPFAGQTNNITASNAAQLNNNINVTVVASGSATAKAAIAAIANTNLNGNCGSFNIVNLFDNQKGNVTLPNELNYISPDKPVAGVNNMYVSNNNNIIMNNNTITVATSSAGIADNITHILNIVNTNITGNNWLYLRINNFGHWNGSLLNWRGDYLADPLGITAWWIGGSRNYAGQVAVQNNNSGKIINNISLSATSGGVGDATVIANIFSLVNTNITGNHWYFAMVNNYADFTGDVVLYHPPDPSHTPSPAANNITNDDPPQSSTPSELSAVTDQLSRPTPSPTSLPPEPSPLIADYKAVKGSILAADNVYHVNLADQNSSFDYCKKYSFACGSIGIGAILSLIILSSGEIGFFKKKYEN